MPTFARWLALAAATAAAALAFDRIGLPSASLFAALVVGLIAALSVKNLPQIAPSVFRAAQAVTGVSLGVYVQSSSLDAIGSAWLPVAVTQYLRVLGVVVLTPILVAVAFSDGGAAGAGGPGPGSAPVIGDLRDWGFTALALGGGALIAVTTRMPAGSLLGPMIVAALLAVTVGDGFQVPAILREPAFAAIGLQVGLRFTPGLLRQAGRLLLPALACIVALLVACFGLALLLHATSDTSLLDAYLATTPGGLYAVLAAAFGTGADTTFVIAVQTLRLFVMVLLAPLVVRRLFARRPHVVLGD